MADQRDETEPIERSTDPIAAAQRSIYATSMRLLTGTTSLVELAELVSSDPYPPPSRDFAQMLRGLVEGGVDEDRIRDFFDGGLVSTYGQALRDGSNADGAWGAVEDEIRRMVAPVATPGARFATGVALSSVRRPHSELLLQMILAMAVAQYEAHLLALVRSYLTARPTTMADSQRAISAADLLGASSLDELVETLRSEYVDALSHGGVSRVQEWLRKQRRISLSLKPAAWGELDEIMARRNAFTHNDGRVSKAYLARVPGCGLDVGALLPIDTDYVLNAMGELEFAGVRLSIAVGADIESCDPIPAVAIGLLDRVDAVPKRAGQWRQLERLFELGLGAESAAIRDGFTVHWALCRMRHLGGVCSDHLDDETQARLEASDDKYVRASLATLLGNFEEGIAVLTNWGAEGRWELFHAEMFRGLREDPRFSNLDLSPPWDPRASYTAFMDRLDRRRPRA